jgi:hypothetical protein
LSHFAKIENGVVTSVIVIDAETLALGHWGDPSEWKQTSYRTSGGQHPEGKPLRFNYAGIGYTYDSGRDAFIPPKPFASWILDEGTCQWGAPTAMPVVEGKRYLWRESDTSWVEQPTYPIDGKTYTWNLETGTWVEVVTA